MAKQILSVKAECIAVNLKKGGGNVLLAVDMTEQAESAQGPLARKVLNYQTTDTKELDGFKVGAQVTVTFTQ